ncbi:9352_t:CDS:2 [Diversispora eburnea]|uniref:9352_t:CDS:1 n=1 Tax=Diversispora eburnea TaxID=1213867 RepID=A0A9N8YNK6_9GLOM|nr:9352_t:CDS:2 [Diversispora eburnea]
MAELQVGNFVLSNVKNNRVEFSEIYLISHLGHYDYSLDMVKIEFTNPDGCKGHIRTTSTHCIFSSDLSILYACDVVPGETKILVLDKINELIPVTVDNHMAFAPIRLWTKVFPSTHRQEELHPYVQILETAYVTWCKGIKMI